VATPNPSLIERKESWARQMSGKEKSPIRPGNPPVRLGLRSTGRLPPGQHLTPGFPILDLGIKPEIALKDWRLEIGGLVENPKTFAWEEFNALPQFEDVSDFHCVTTWSKFDCRWRGVAFFTLAEIVKPKPEVRHVLFSSYDGTPLMSELTTRSMTTRSWPPNSTANRLRAIMVAPPASSSRSFMHGKGPSLFTRLNSLAKISRVSGKSAATVTLPTPGRRTGSVDV